jgi:hypothetical protein
MCFASGCRRVKKVRKVAAAAAVATPQKVATIQRRKALTKRVLSTFIAPVFYKYPTHNRAHSEAFLPTKTDFQVQSQCAPA